jgi:cystathionine beta-lyase/cystathionine gamma-synthase
LERGLKTFELRAERMSFNAQAIAEFLKTRNKITRILYPGLPEDKGYNIAKHQMHRGFGGILAFDVGKNQEDAKNFISNLNTIYHAVSLGSTESLICIPYLTTMLYMPEERRIGFGVNTNTVRLSAGIENTDTLIEDISQALEKL